MSEREKTRSILNLLEAVRADIEKTIDESDSRHNWRTIVRGTLMHWLGQIWDEGAGYTIDLETAVRVLRGQLDKQKDINTALRLEFETYKRLNPDKPVDPNAPKKDTR